MTCSTCPFAGRGITCLGIAGRCVQDKDDERAIRLAQVASCPERGGVLPISMQDNCGCQGKELSECRAGRGKMPGRVTLADCLECRNAGA